MIRWIFFLLPVAFARDLETEYLARLRAAQSAQQVQSIRDSYDQLVSKRRICRIQMVQKQIPTACYQSLKLEQEWRLISRERADAIRKFLDGLCKKAAKSEVQLGTLDFSDLSQADLSPLCRNVLRKVHDIRRYRAADDPALEGGWPNLEN